MNKDIIKISELEVKYGKNIIIDNVNFNIKEGEIVGFLGPSGCGKTTLVKSIIGMNSPSKGYVEVLSEKMPSLKVVSEFGYMAQSDALYDDLTGIDNLLFFCALYGVKKDVAKVRATELFKLVNLEDHAKKYVKDFSGGMKRRLSLAIALVHKPKILILDEPTVGIDPILRQKFWKEFDRIKKDGGTIIITTHVMDEAYRCDRLVMLRDGKIIASGSPTDIINESGGKTIEDAFIHFSSDKGEF